MVGLRGYFDDYRLEHTIRQAHISISSLKIGGFSLEENFTEKSNFHVFTENGSAKFLPGIFFAEKLQLFSSNKVRCNRIFYSLIKYFTLASTREHLKINCQFSISRVNSCGKLSGEIYK